ncbi:TRAM domain-containing protein [bacterium]|nr:TRAM domain-containing protein [bacterium]
MLRYSISLPVLAVSCAKTTISRTAYVMLWVRNAGRTAGSMASTPHLYRVFTKVQRIITARHRGGDGSAYRVDIATACGTRTRTLKTIRCQLLKGPDRIRKFLVELVSGDFLAIVYHVTDLTSDGRGVARTEEGRVVFLAGAMPGDRVLAALEAQGTKGPLTGRVREILVPSPDRREHPCPHYAEGCPASPLGVLEDRAERDWKRHHLLETLVRMGPWVERDAPPGTPGAPRLSDEEQRTRNEERERLRARLDGMTGATLPSLASLHYRDRIEPRLEPLQGGWRMLYGKGEVDVALADCLLASVAIREAMQALSVRLKEGMLKPDPSFSRRSVRLLLRSNGREQAVAVLFVMTGRKFDPAPYVQWLRDIPALAGWQVRMARQVKTRMTHSTILAEAGDTGIMIRVGTQSLQAPPTIFTQANESMRDRLVEVALDDVVTGGNLLDLYGGYGSFGLEYVRRGGRATVVDTAPDALAAGWQFAREHDLEVDFIEADLARRFPRRLALETRDAVLLDPPRGGAGRNVLKVLDAHGPGRLVYVSCHPATLARDLGRLPAYRLVRLTPVDMFPQTPDLETVAVLQRDR